MPQPLSLILSASRRNPEKESTLRELLPLVADSVARIFGRQSSGSGELGPGSRSGETLEQFPVLQNSVQNYAADPVLQSRRTRCIPITRGNDGRPDR